MVNKKPRLNTQAKFTILENEGLIINQKNNLIHITNEVGAFLLPLLNGELSIKELSRKVSAQFDISTTEAQNDIGDFCDTLHEKGILNYE